MTNVGIEYVSYTVVDENMTIFYCNMHLMFFSSYGNDSSELEKFPDSCGLFCIHTLLKLIVKHAQLNDNGLFTAMCHPVDA